MHAGALHSIITDGVWYPQRVANVAKHSDGKGVLCKCENAGLQHIWCECGACMQLGVKPGAVATQSDQNPNGCRTTVSLDNR
eukprot:10622134-Heterocapsa_arctica.AAC.1